jgi:hypothetical protein
VKESGDREGVIKNSRSVAIRLYGVLHKFWRIGRLEELPADHPESPFSTLFSDCKINLPLQRASVLEYARGGCETSDRAAFH